MGPQQDGNAMVCEMRRLWPNAALSPLAWLVRKMMLHHRGNPQPFAIGLVRGGWPFMMATNSQ